MFSKKRISLMYLAGVLFIHCLFSGFSVNAQETRNVTLSRDDTIIMFDILIQKTLIKTKPELIYSWYRSDSLYRNQGGFSGYLLHGLFNVYIHHSTLIEQGPFKNGLKNGDWKYWDNKGKLIRLTHYSEGLRQGKSMEVMNDTLVKSCYKKDLLHGLQYYEYQEITKVLYYKKGKPLPGLPWWAGIMIWLNR